ncbi:NAD(P)-dependent alcohol dehydrogenase [Catelliglobosispora koreensis]|uniref:NAD(P)-dependent alcohol dehydrogenase n=1 Tax=Catelliglobosispora koreensis TaxID=129052 RepID=UPI0003767AD8|nr:NAD(P)-dependent alcohol dehydrogenase [Catelliglobosispora koreensis]
MKAVVYTRYGSPDELKLSEVPTPEPKDDEVLVRVHATSLNRSDWEGLIGKPWYARLGGVRKPRRKVLGSDIAGRVEKTGSNVTDWQPGDEVFADALSVMGGFAELICVPANILARKPVSMSFEEAACLPQAGAIAWQGIGEKVRAGQRVLINGAGGGTGMYAIQLAKLLGAEVTGVDNAEKLEFMRSVGADHVIDYEAEDFTRKRYDVILDLVAYRNVFAYKRALNPHGRYQFVGGSAGTLLQTLLLGPLTGKKIRMLVVRQGAKHLAPFIELCKAGKIRTVIDRRFSLSEVPQALRYLGEGHAKGKIVISPLG